jgi:hypothetical protein
MQFATARRAEADPQPGPASSLRSSRTNESVSNPDSLKPIVERALNCTGATGAALAMLRDHEMVWVATAGSLVPPLGARLQTGSSFSGKCVRLRRLLRCDDVESDSRIDRENCRSLGIRSMVVVPIDENGVVVGLLEVFAGRANAFSEIAELDLEFLARSVLLAGRPGPRPIEDKYGKSTKESENSEDGLRVDADRQQTSPSPRSRFNYYKLGLGVACLGIVIGSWLKVGRGVLAPVQGDVQTAMQSASNSDSPLADTNDQPEISKLAAQGDPAAQFALGAKYATGENVQQDYSQAVGWFSKAAEQGHVLAQATLGAYYMAGRGVPTDLSKAYFWSILAQAGGDQASEYRINILKSRLTPREIVAIKKQASDWLKLHHQPSPKESSIQH